MSATLPRYPVYIPSKGRADIQMTAAFLARDGVPFWLVVEPQEADAYAAAWGRERILTLPDQNRGTPWARNWIKAHAIAAGTARHWQLDDNMRCIRRLYRGRRIPCQAGIALAAAEDFTDRYENVAISGLNYTMFLPPTQSWPPFHRNCRVYSCTLVLNATPHAWRGPYNDDTDLCLQVLADGWCTLLFNVFMVDKAQTMAVKGGQTPIYQGDGRLKMARCLERRWPGVVTTDRRFQRPQHVVADSWRKFDTPLRLKPGVTLEDLAAGGENEYGMALTAVRPVKSAALRALVEHA